MTTKIRRMKVFFRHAVSLPNCAKPLPAGGYEVAWSQKVTDGQPSAAFPQPCAGVQLAALNGGREVTRSVTITWEDLGRALARDAATSRRSGSGGMESAFLDPIIQDLMQRDGLSEDQLRRAAASATERQAHWLLPVEPRTGAAVIGPLESLDE